MARRSACAVSAARHRLSHLTSEVKVYGTKSSLEHYRQEVVPVLMEEFNYTSAMQVPRIAKVTLNIGVGEAGHKALDAAVKTCARLRASSR